MNRLTQNRRIAHWNVIAEPGKRFLVEDDPPEADGQLHTLGLLEQLRNGSKALSGASSAAYFRADELLRQLATPNLRDFPINLPFRVERWHRDAVHTRWVVSASSSITVAHAAMAYW